MVPTPVRLLTTFGLITEENWPGEVPVEIVHADDYVEFEAKLPGIDVVVDHVFTEAHGNAADSLRLIQSISAGHDMIDLDAVPEGCVVANVYEHEGPVAEWVIMAMIALDRHLLAADQALRAGSWQFSPMHGHLVNELAGRTVTIVGTGRIGRKVAEFASVFGMRVVGVNRTVPPSPTRSGSDFDTVVGLDRLDEVVAGSDFVVLCLALADETTGLIGERTLAAMGQQCCVVNVARAEIIEQAPLFAALRDGRLRGAALDVWYREPSGPDHSPQPADQPFWDLDNVILSPHSAAATTAVLERRLGFVAANVDRVARGEPAINVVG